MQVRTGSGSDWIPRLQVGVGVPSLTLPISKYYSFRVGIRSLPLPVLTRLKQHNRLRADRLPFADSVDRLAGFCLNAHAVEVDP